MFIVTKVEDTEELDTRFSKFSPFAEAESENLLSQLADEFLEAPGIWKNFWGKMDLLA